MALTVVFRSLGLARTSALNASLLQGAVPILTLILAAAILGERLGARRILAHRGDNRARGGDAATVSPHPYHSNISVDPLTFIILLLSTFTRV